MVPWGLVSAGVAGAVAASEGFKSWRRNRQLKGIPACSGQWPVLGRVSALKVPFAPRSGLV